MIEFKIDDFLNNCKRKGLSTKTIASYEQTLRLFQVYLMEYYNVSELKKLKFTMFEAYLDYLKSRGKYTIVSDLRSKNINFPENRLDFNKKISTTTINNYQRNIKVFLNWCFEHNFIKIKLGDKIKQIKNPRQPREYIEDSEVQRLFKCYDISNAY